MCWCLYGWMCIWCSCRWLGGQSVAILCLSTSALPSPSSSNCGVHHWWARCVPSLYTCHYVLLIFSRAQAICGGQYHSEEEGWPVKCTAFQVSRACKPAVFTGLIPNIWSPNLHNPIPDILWYTFHNNYRMGLWQYELCIYLQVCSCAGPEDGSQRWPWVSPGSRHILLPRAIHPSARGTYIINCVYIHQLQSHLHSHIQGEYLQSDIEDTKKSLKDTVVPAVSHMCIVLCEVQLPIYMSW